MQVGASPGGAAASGGSGRPEPRALEVAGCIDSVSRVTAAADAPTVAAPLRIGPLSLRTPVVLAPMAGVTNAPFRVMCRRFGPDLLYVNEMVMAIAVAHRNAKTERMMTFSPDESPRSLQLYASDPVSTGEAVRRLVGEGLVDHIDMNFGCPAAKVTRRGGGAAVPLKRNLLRAVVRAAVSAASPAGVGTTARRRSPPARVHVVLSLAIALAAAVVAAALGAAAAARPAAIPVRVRVGWGRRHPQR